MAGWRLACAETSASAMELDSFHCSEGTIRSVAGATAGGGKSESESKGECDESACIPRNTPSLGGVVVPHKNSGETAPGPEWVCEADMITLARGTVKPLDTAMAYAMSITLLCTLSPRASVINRVTGVVLLRDVPAGGTNHVESEEGHGRAAVVDHEGLHPRRVDNALRWVHPVAILLPMPDG